MFSLVISSATMKSHDNTPSPKQTKPVVLTKAKIYTGRDILEQASIIFDKGKITAIGANLPLPAGADVIDCSGKSIYPSFIAPNSTVGLTEIDAVRATRDASETGAWNPNARGDVAYNPDSEIIPTVRSNGILIANVSPQGGWVAGRSSLMMLDGWTREDASLKRTSALMVTMPNMVAFSAPYIKKTADEQRKESENQLKELYTYFYRAREYSKLARAGAVREKDIRMEAMREVFENEVPIIVGADEVKQIYAAIDFAKEFQTKLIILGGADSWRCLPAIKASGASIILNRTHSLPQRDEEPIDQPFRLPSILVKNGIRFAFSEGGMWQQRNLPFEAGTAVSFGLTEAEAIRALTIDPATMFGVQNQVGSLEVGKDATLFVSSGNALDGLTNNVTNAWIQGRPVDLRSKQTRLAEKYRAKLKQAKSE